MPRTARASVGDVIYHVMNRWNASSQVFHDDEDYAAFIDLLRKAHERLKLGVLAYCVMPNHFHLVLRPHKDGDLGLWMHWLLTSHVRRHHHRHQSSGHIWQGRFKAFPVQDDVHLFTVLRYVERNPLRAGLVTDASAWPWSSLRWWRCRKRPPFLEPTDDVTSADWVALVQSPHTDDELVALRQSAHRGTPFGSAEWVDKVAHKMGLQFTLNPPGRPRGWRK